MPLEAQSSPPEFRQLPDIRALVLDDSSFDRKRIRRVGGDLDLPLVIDEASSVQMLRQRLDQQTYDLFLIDYRMPDADGLAALDMIQSHAAHADAASIMISGNADTRVAVTALKHGCRDFLVKDDLSPALLRQAVLSALTTSRQFSRFFEPARPSIDLDDIRGLLRLALEDQSVRDIIRAPLEEGLLVAARNIGMGDAQRSAADLEQFLIAFCEPDDFSFH